MIALAADISKYDNRIVREILAKKERSFFASTTKLLKSNQKL